MPNSTLEKVTYTTLQKFVEQVNRNFAVIQNSPLFKGIPGNPGASVTGATGLRGSQFLFVSPNFTKFVEKFPGEITAPSNITQAFLNAKLQTNENELLYCFSITGFVSNDIIVLSNSLMLSYDFLQDKFIDTTIAFNEQSNFVSMIETQIEALVQQAIADNPTLNNIEDIFDVYRTIAKNYTDTNNTYINGNSTSSSIYVPFVQGYTSTVGTEIENHKYFGFSDIMFPKTNDGTFVIGSMKKYIDLLTNTLSPSEADTFTSDYAPGVGNIPALVVLQDTVRNGLMIGKKADENLVNFASIYKNADGELAIQNAQGPEPAPGEDTLYSRILLNNTRMLYKKHAIFGSMDITTNLNVLGHVNNKFLRSGVYTVSQNADTNEVGSNINNGTGAQTIYTSENQRFTRFPSCLLVTNNQGDVQKDYALEDTTLDMSLISSNGGTDAISVVPSDDKKIVTSKYANYIIQKLNVLSNLLKNNYYTVSEFTENVIPALALNTALQVGAQVNNPVFSVDNTKTKIGDSVNYETEINGKLILKKYLSRVLVTNASGEILGTYKVDDTTYNQAETASGVPITPLTVEANNTKLLTEAFANFVISKINNIESTTITEQYLSTNYYTKAEFIDDTIPAITLNSSLTVRGTGGDIFSAVKGTNRIAIGTVGTKTTLNGDLYVNNAVGRTYKSIPVYGTYTGNNVTDGKMNLYDFNDFAAPDSTAPGLTLIGASAVDTLLTDSLAAVGNQILNGRFLRYVVTRINNLLTYLTPTQVVLLTSGDVAIPNNVAQNTGAQGEAQTHLTWVQGPTAGVYITKHASRILGRIEVDSDNGIESHQQTFIAKLPVGSRPQRGLIIPAVSVYSTYNNNVPPTGGVNDAGAYIQILPSGEIYAFTGLAGNAQVISAVITFEL